MTDDKKTYLLLKSPNLYKAILLMALPIMFSNILKSVHDIVDMYFVGNLAIDPMQVEAMVSAITVTNPIIQIFQALATGLMIAGTALMSQYLGANKEKEAKTVNAQLLIMCTIFGIVFNILLFFLTTPILKIMGAASKPDVFMYAKEYVMIRSFEMTGLFIFFAYQATRQATGDTVTPVILNVVSILLNIVLTAIMVRKYYLVGAAYATVIANLIIIPVCFILYFKTKATSIKLEFKDLKPNFKYMKQTFILGVPAAISQAFTSVGFLIINSIILSFEGYLITAIGVGNRINSILLFPTMAVGSVLATFVGQNIGASNVKRAKASVKASVVISLIISIVGGVSLMFLRKDLASIFIINNELALDACVDYLYFLLLGLPLMGIFQVLIGAFQGAARTDFSLILSSLRLWVLRIPVIMLYMKVFNVGEKSIFYAMIISNVGAVIIGTFMYTFIDFKPRFTKMKQKMLKQIEKEVVGN